MSNRDELMKLVKGTVAEGTVTLASGATSDFYIDGRQTSLDSRGLYLTSQLMWERIKTMDVTAVGGPTMGADPIVGGILMAAAADGAHLKGFLIRKEAKAHGMQKWVEGPPLKDGERVVLIEDVVTSGGSALKAIEGMRTQYSPTIVKILCLVDRQAGATEKLKAAGYDYEALFTRKDLGR
ncbi:MAG: orotate phosphoribosyltransferase [Planctomycetes bacterium]|nr:orotate phosphoribosyltransferase [Planctomycetota bacterium]